MFVNLLFALAVQEMGINRNILLVGALFAALFTVSMGWVTRTSGTKSYGRYQQRTTVKTQDL